MTFVFKRGKEIKKEYFAIKLKWFLIIGQFNAYFSQNNLKCQKYG